MRGMTLVCTTRAIVVIQAKRELGLARTRRVLVLACMMNLNCPSPTHATPHPVWLHQVLALAQAKHALTVTHTRRKLVLARMRSLNRSIFDKFRRVVECFCYDQPRIRSSHFHHGTAAPSLEHAMASIPDPQVVSSSKKGGKRMGEAGTARARTLTDDTSEAKRREPSAVQVHRHRDLSFHNAHKPAQNSAELELTSTWYLKELEETTQRMLAAQREIAEEEIKAPAAEENVRAAMEYARLRRIAAEKSKEKLDAQITANQEKARCEANTRCRVVLHTTAPAERQMSTLNVPEDVRCKLKDAEEVRAVEELTLVLSQSLRAKHAAACLLAENAVDHQETARPYGRTESRIHRSTPTAQFSARQDSKLMHHVPPQDLFNNDESRDVRRRYGGKPDTVQPQDGGGYLMRSISSHCNDDVVHTDRPPVKALDGGVKYWGHMPELRSGSSGGVIYQCAVYQSTNHIVLPNASNIIGYKLRVVLAIWRVHMHSEKHTARLIAIIISRRSAIVKTEWMNTGTGY
ncbi:hypothetical protein B0H13DRAFT_1882090 [Mycena leptocephala]|nr:hypothetical protein B0H13DRAFT_1882090 [Mycena leptocephala]